MAIVVKMEESKFPEVTEGMYPVILEAIEAKTGQYGPALSFNAVIQGGKFDKIKVSGLVSATLQPGNKLDKWLRAFGASPVGMGGELDVETIVGQSAQAYIVPKAGKKEGSVFNNIKSFTPADGVDSIPDPTPAPAAATPVAAAPVAAPIAAPAAGATAAATAAATPDPTAEDDIAW